MNKDIKLGFWNYVKSGVIGKEAVKDWKELGSNLPMSFEFDADLHNKQDMLDILDECEKEGLKLIICDKRTHFRTCAALSPETFLKGVREAYEDFGKHPATFGFFAGDEPTEDYVPAFIEAYRVLLKEMPKLTPFGNVFPYWSGCDFDMASGKDEAYFYKLMSRILTESNVPVIAYDHYTQCLQENQNQELGINSWFYDLDMFHKVTKDHGKFFYVSTLAVGHWSYRVPTEDDIRWQIYTALAHGARGIIWFHLYNLKGDCSYRNAPFYGDRHKRTEMFTYIQRQQEIFRECFEEQFNKMELTDVYHMGHFYNPSKRFTEDATISALTADWSYPVIVSYYKEFDSDERWVSFVNAHQRYTNLLRIQFACGTKKVFWLAPGEMQLFKLSELEAEAKTKQK